MRLFPFRSDILRHSGKWVLDEVGICRSKNGITNNLSEGINSLLKKLANWPGIPTDAVVTALYFLQRYKYNEILRGRLQVGDFQMKEIHLDQALEPSEVNMPNSVCTPEQIVDLIKAGNLEVPFGEDNKDGPQSPDPITRNATRIEDVSVQATDNERQYKPQRPFAIDVIKNKRIWQVPECGSWIVKGSKDDKYAVTLFPVEKCSCSALGNCYHIQAAKMSIGQIEDSGKRILNMSRIRSASKKRQNKRAGNKKPRPIDIYDAINAK